MPSDRKRRLTRRGHYLLAFGVVQLALGLAYLGQPTTGAGRLAVTLLPAWAYVSASLAVGGLAFVAAFVRPSLERSAFAGLAAITAARCLSYAAVVGAELIGPEPVNPGLVAIALAFGLLVRVHLLVSGWPDPPHLVAPVELTQAQLAALGEYLLHRTAEGEAE